MKIFWPKSEGRTASFFWCFLVYAGEKIPSHWDVGTQKLQNSLWWQENENVNEQFWVWWFCILIEEFLLKIQAFHKAKSSILVIDQNLGQPHDPMCPLGAHFWFKAGLHIAGKTPGKESRGASLLQNLKWSQLWESEMSVQAPLLCSRFRDSAPERTPQNSPTSLRAPSHFTQARCSTPWMPPDSSFLERC